MPDVEVIVAPTLPPTEEADELLRMRGKEEDEHLVTMNGSKCV